MKVEHFPVQEGELGASALQPIAQELSSASAPTSGLIAEGLLCLVTVMAAEGPSLCPLQEGHHEAPGSFLTGAFHCRQGHCRRASLEVFPQTPHELLENKRCRFFNENH